MDTDDPAVCTVVLANPHDILAVSHTVDIMDIDQQELFFNGLKHLVGLPPKTTPETDHIQKLYEFGVELVRLEKLTHAFVCFNEILRIRFYYLRSYLYLNTVRSRLVRQWHIRMLNDPRRIAVFKKAVHLAVSNCPSDYRVLNIGTGTGLLTVHAARAGCKSIVACDESSLMHSIAQQTLKNNHIGEHVRLVNRYSTDLQPDDIGGAVDLVITDNLDSSGFGEGILQTLIHAKTHLLKDNGRIIPQRITFFIAGFESRSIAHETVSTNLEFEEFIYLKNTRLVAHPTASGYSTENTRLIKDFKIITNVQEAFSCDFNDVVDMQSILDGKKYKKVLLSYKRAGFLDGFVMWFELGVDKAGTLGSEPSVPSCWDQMVFKLKHRFANAQKLHYLNLTISCPGGVWNVHHYYDYTGRVLNVGQDVIRFINDTKYLHKLEIDFFASDRKTEDKVAAPNNRTSYGNILDFSPFPYIGISLLKEKRATRLYCSTAAEELVRFVAVHNCLADDQIVFVNDPDAVLNITDMFDVIIMDLIDSQGSVNCAQVTNYGVLQKDKLNAGGRMIPSKIEVWCRVIRSDWMVQDNYLSNRHLAGSNVVDVINSLAIDHKENLGDFEHTSLSNPFRCGELRLNADYCDNLLMVPTKDIETLTGILYWYHISFTETSTAITTFVPSSYIRRACFITDPSKTINNNQCTALRFIQHQGVIRITNNLGNK